MTVIIIYSINHVFELYALKKFANFQDCIFLMRQSLCHCNFYFNSIGDIIDHYRKEQIVEGYYLKEPVPMQVSIIFLFK